MKHIEGKIINPDWLRSVAEEHINCHPDVVSGLCQSAETIEYLRAQLAATRADAEKVDARVHSLIDVLKEIYRDSLTPWIRELTKTAIAAALEKEIHK